jgi:hypothetical protein
MRLVEWPSRCRWLASVSGRSGEGADEGLITPPNHPSRHKPEWSEQSTRGSVVNSGGSKMLDVNRSTPQLSVRRYRCRLVRVIYESSQLKPVTGEMKERQTEVVVRHKFEYAGRRYRRGEVLTVSSTAVDHLVSSKKARLKEGEACHKN